MTLQNHDECAERAEDKDSERPRSASVELKKRQRRVKLSPALKALERFLHSLEAMSENERRAMVGYINNWYYDKYRFGIWAK
jgi:hypothetical protein